MPELLPYPRMPAVVLDPPPVDLRALVIAIRDTIDDPGHITRFRLSEAHLGVYTPADGLRDAMRTPLPSIPFAPGIVLFPGDEGPAYCRPNTFPPLGSPASAPYEWNGGHIQAWWVSYQNWNVLAPNNGWNIIWKAWDGLVYVSVPDIGGESIHGYADGCPIYPWPYPIPNPQTQDEYHEWYIGFFGGVAGIPQKTKSGIIPIVAAVGLLAALALTVKPPELRARKNVR